MKLVNSSTQLDGSVLKKEARSALRKLSVIYNEKKKIFDWMEQLIEDIEGAPEETKAALNKELEYLESECWWGGWVCKGSRFQLQELRGSNSPIFVILLGR